jgi:hypothetical protein
MRDSELLHELEDEFELEEEGGLHEDEYEGVLGTIGNVVGSLLGESESEDEYEVHEHELHEHGEAGFHEFEGEHGFLEHGEAGFHEFEGEHGFLEHGEAGFHEFEGEHGFLEHGEMGFNEFEFEQGELFFGRIGRFIKRAAPFLKRIARVAVPLVSSAVGGPLGGILGRVATSALSESELEYEDELELELEGEAAMHEFEAAMAAPLTEHQALAELMASVAAEAHNEAEAEAMIGAATVNSLSARERRELRRVLAHLVRGSAILTRLLRRRRITRPAVRAVPAIVHATADTLTRRAAAGRPITRRTAGRVMAAHTGRVLSSPRACTLAIQRNVRATRTVQRRTGIPTVSYRPNPAVVRRARASAVTGRRVYR